jgi:hypothetical protein
MPKNRPEAPSDGARHHHHHHGAGIEGAPTPGLADLKPLFWCSELRVEFHLRRHLLEQPSPHVSFHETRDRRHPVGEPAPAVLVVALSVHDGLDGRKPSRADSHSCLWLRAADGSHRVLHSGTHHHCPARTRLPTRSGGWEGPQRQTLAGVLSRRHSACVREPPWISALYVFVALLWLVPDRRIERVLAKRDKE